MSRDKAFWMVALLLTLISFSVVWYARGVRWGLFALAVVLLVVLVESVRWREHDRHEMERERTRDARRRAREAFEVRKLGDVHSGKETTPRWVKWASERDKFEESQRLSRERQEEQKIERREEERREREHQRQLELLQVQHPQPDTGAVRKKVQHTYVIINNVDGHRGHRKTGFGKRSRSAIEGASPHDVSIHHRQRITCLRCKGAGTVPPVVMRMHVGAPGIPDSVACPKCEGKGWVWDDEV